MRTPALPRRVAALAVAVAIATSMLSTSASAQESRAAVSVAALPRIGELDGYGEADWQRLAQQACSSNGATPDIDSVIYDQSGGNVEALLISGAVDRDGDQELDAVCTFAVIATRADTGEQYSNYLSDGTWRLQAGESGTSSYFTKEGWILGQATVITSPIFTGVEHYAVAELTASGYHRTAKAVTVTVPARAKSPSQIRTARAARDSGIKVAKMNYKNAKKRANTIKNTKKRTAAKSRAKRVYKRAIQRNQEVYARRVLPTPATTRPGQAPVTAPFSLSLTNDD